MDLTKTKFRWSSINYLGIDESMDDFTQKHIRIYNRIVGISLLTFLSFLPLSGVIESVIYLLILLSTALALCLCLWLSSLTYFIPSKILFFFTLTTSIALITMHLGINSKVHLSFILIGTLPLLYLKRKLHAFYTCMYCIVAFFLVQFEYFEFYPVEVDSWKLFMLYNCIVIGLVVVGFFYNAIFKMIAEERVEELMGINSQISIQNQHILENIALAREIQSNLLPDQKSFNSIFPNALVFYKSKELVGGDFYWIESVGNVKYCAVIDSTGHGVPGAFVSIIGHQALNRCINNLGLKEPQEIMNKLHELVYQVMRKEDSNILDGMDMSLLMLDEKNKRLALCGAHNSALLLRNKEFELAGFEPQYEGAEKKMFKIQAQSQSVGSEYLKESFVQVDIPVKKGDIIYMYTDGYVDQFGGEFQKKLLHKPFKMMLLKNQHLDMLEQQNQIVDFYESWKGDVMQVDDVCVVGIKL